MDVIVAVNKTGINRFDEAFHYFSGLEPFDNANWHADDRINCDVRNARYCSGDFILISMVWAKGASLSFGAQWIGATTSHCVAFSDLDQLLFWDISMRCYWKSSPHLLPLYQIVVWLLNKFAQPIAGNFTTWKRDNYGSYSLELWNHYHDNRVHWGRAIVTLITPDLRFVFFFNFVSLLFWYDVHETCFHGRMDHKLLTTLHTFVTSLVNTNW